MGARYFALILGIVYLLIGILGFIPGVNDMAHAGMAAHPVSVNASYGFLLGLFPVNVLHNLVHIIIGIWGLLAYRTFDASRAYARINGVLFVVLAIMGLVPAANLDTAFGLIPLFGNDVWLHALVGIFGLITGFIPQLAYSRDRLVGERA